MIFANEPAFDLGCHNAKGDWVRVNTYDSIHDAKAKAKKFAAAQPLGQHVSTRMRILCLGGQIYECTFKAGRRVNWVRRV